MRYFVSQDASTSMRVSVASLGNLGSSIASLYATSPFRTHKLETLYLFDVDTTHGDGGDGTVGDNKLQAYWDVATFDIKSIDSVFISVVDCGVDTNDGVDMNDTESVFKLYSTIKRALGNANVVLDVKGCGDTIDPTSLARELLA